LRLNYAHLALSSFIVIAGLSGAGRTQAANSLEDLGWFVMDNLPPALIPKVAELAQERAASAGPLALVVGTGHYHDEIVTMIEDLRSGVAGLRTVFLDASTETLVRRYESSRRRHPFAEDAPLPEAIASEREALAAVRATSDVVIDTTALNIHELRDRVVELFGGGTLAGMRVTVVSFGYTHGVPRDADIVIDCRFLPNPHWVEKLRPFTGTDAAVFDYVMAQPDTKQFLERLESLLELLLPKYVSEGKSYLTLAFGCTGGRHRSVAIAEHIAGVLGSSGFEPALAHRDISK